MVSLNKKRIDSLEVIFVAAGIGGFTTFAPTPAIEVPKQVVTGFADIAMCPKI